MQPLRIYGYLTLARGRLFEQMRPLSAEQYAQRFPIGPGSLGGTLTHIMISEWYYTQRILGREVPDYERWPIRSENPPPLADLEAAWALQASDTRSVLGGVKEWDAPLEYRVRDDDGSAKIVTASAGDLFVQLAFHEVHHRAQVMNMLRHLGIAAEDLDYNALMYTRRDEPT